MVVASDVKREVSSAVKTRIDELIERRQEIVMPDVANEIANVLGRNPDFVRQAGEEYLRSAVYDHVQRVVARTRSIDYIAAGQTLMPREDFSEFANRSTNRLFDRWVEHVGDRSVLFLQMTRSDIDAAIEERLAVVKHHGDIVVLMAEVRTKLANDTMQVKDVFSADQLETMYSCIQDKSTQQPYI